MVVRGESGRPSGRPVCLCTNVVILTAPRGKGDFPESQFHDSKSNRISWDNFQSMRFDWEIYIRISHAIARVNVSAVQGLIRFFECTHLRAIHVGITVRFHDRQN